MASNKLIKILEDDELREWVDTVDANTLKAAINIGKWIIEKMSCLDIISENSAIRAEIQAEAQTAVNEMRMERDYSIRQLEFMKASLSEKDSKLREMDNSLKNIVNEFCEGELNKLRQLVAEKDNEIKSLRNTNAVKGVIGENLIMDILKDIFRDASIVNTGKHAHECDIQMTDSIGNLIAFESKYKTTITKGDIDKFYYDVENLPGLHGAVFVSINSCNIPGKGDVCIEFANVPLLFIGFNGADDFSAHFPSIVRMFVKFCEVAKKQEPSEEEHVDVNALLDDIEQCLSTMIKNNARISKFHSMVDKAIDELEANNKDIIDRITAVLETSGRSIKKTRKRTTK